MQQAGDRSGCLSFLSGITNLSLIQCDLSCHHQQTQSMQNLHRRFPGAAITAAFKWMIMASVSAGVAVMHMQSPPVNSLSLEFLTDVCIALEKLEMDKSCRGLVVTSVQLKQLCADGLTSVLQWSLSCLQFHNWSLNMLSIMTVYPAGLASGCVLPWNPEPAQGVLSRAGHLGHVWEESRALCGVLESCARDVAQVLWLQHDHYSSSQCTYRTTQHLPPHCLHLTQGQSGAFWGANTLK